jgi:prevent-host-death family protein
MAIRTPKNRAGRHALPKSHAPAGPIWQLQTAKARFSEVFRLALAGGPQRITRGGRESVVVLPAAQFDALVARSEQPKSLVEFFKRSPLAGLDLKLERDRDSGRDIEL